jgi:hypothetical protein
MAPTVVVHPLNIRERKLEEEEEDRIQGWNEGRIQAWERRQALVSECTDLG